jgi:hypothetical protein
MTEAPAETPGPFSFQGVEVSDLDEVELRLWMRSRGDGR